MEETFSVHQPVEQFTTNYWPNYITLEKKAGRLSFGAIMIMLYIKGQTPDWVPRKKDMMEQLDISPNTFEKYMKQLINCGYVKMERGRRPVTGHWYSDYVFYFDPTDNEDYKGELPAHYFDRVNYMKEKLERRQKEKAASDTTPKRQKRKQTNKTKTPKHSVPSDRKKTSKKTKSFNSTNTAAYIDEEDFTLED